MKKLLLFLVLFSILYVNAKAQTFYVTKSPDVSQLIQKREKISNIRIIDYLEEDNRKDLLKIFTEAVEFDKGASIKFLRVDLIPKK